MPLDCSLTAQAERRAALHQRHREVVGSVATVHIQENSSRSRLWESLAWFSGPDPDLELLERYVIGADPWGPCAFTSCNAMQVLARHAEAMRAGLRAHLEGYVREHIGRELGLRFEGYNDNFPAMSACCLALAGRYFGNPEWSRGSEAVLDSALALLQRRDYFSEYLSSCYSPITLAMLAEIVNLGEAGALREKAAELERRGWLEILSHWHLPTHALAGPHSRSYEADSVCHMTDLCDLMWGCLGSELVTVNPYDHLYPAPEWLVIHHEGDVDFVRAGALWMTGTDMHLPEEAVRYLREPGYPRTEIGRAEGGNFRDIVPAEAGFDPPWVGHSYPPCVNRVVSFLGESFSLGTADRDWLNGDQHDIFSLKSATGHRAEQPQPCRSLFTRYVSGEKTPGADNWYADMKKSSTRDLLHEEGRRRCVQHENLALVAYWPKRRLEKAATGKLALNLLVPVHYSRPEELWVGEQQVNEAAVETAAPAPVYLREGETFAAFLPLQVDDLGRQAATRAEQRGRYLVVEWVNYEGEPRLFTQPELLQIRNGFVALVEEAQGRDFAAWRAAVGMEITDLLTHELRHVEVRRGETVLQVRFSPENGEAQYATVNGRAVD